VFVSVLNDQSFSMQVKDGKSTSDDGWRKVWGKEAAAINPLAAVNQGRNSLILEAVRTNDWSDYHNFQAKQHPAWYDNVGGVMKQNKLYYGNLIDVQYSSLKEAVQSGDKAEIARRKAQKRMAYRSHRALGLTHLIIMRLPRHKAVLKINTGMKTHILLIIRTK